MVRRWVRLLDVDAPDSPAARHLAGASSTHSDSPRRTYTSGVSTQSETYSYSTERFGPAVARRKPRAAASSQPARFNVAAPLAFISPTSAFVVTGVVCPLAAFTAARARRMTPRSGSLSFGDGG